MVMVAVLIKKSGACGYNFWKFTYLTFYTYTLQKIIQNATKTNQKQQMHHHLLLVAKSIILVRMFWCSKPRLKHRTRLEVQLTQKYNHKLWQP
jgi:hypothetical protein